MCHFALAVFIGIACPAIAEEALWVPLDGEEIREALTERVLKYSLSTQKFYGSGKTLYDAGRPSWGYWRVEGDQYCSQWPPNDLWVCYGVERRGEAVRFVGAQGDITEGVYLDAE